MKLLNANIQIKRILNLIYVNTCNDYYRIMGPSLNDMRPDIGTICFILNPTIYFYNKKYSGFNSLFSKSYKYFE